MNGNQSTLPKCHEQFPNSLASIKSSSGDVLRLGVNYIVDTNTRCEHYQSKLDIICIKFKCCDVYYPCFQCHNKINRSLHKTERWSKLDLKAEKVILCGFCFNELLFEEYSKSDYYCVYCNSKFNPKCALHYDLYFDLT
ncbi:uncharacterized protein PRCAT00000594001 [Priceomyces carsonii]|uniref:uncharacterized protein n=1 Tax=Priceomyces carsonii TaxID=28549 RepID=UPI002EDA58FC|nr:unnamed protein product [Priceomyces carsonii]